MRHKVILLAAAIPAVGALIAAGAVTAGASSAGPHTGRPHAAARAGTMTTSNPVVAQSQEFQGSTGDFCQGATAPCDGAANDYGTIDRVQGGYTNGGSGNYAPDTRALTGSWMAVVDGTGDVNQGNGCPSSATEACTGPYWLPGTGSAMGAENVFPSTGFTVTSDLYLDPATFLGTNSQVDDDWAINNSSGGYGQDEVVSVCAVGGGLALSFGNSSPGMCGATADITTAGWYRFVEQFSNSGGDAYVTASVYAENGLSRVFTSGPQPVGGTPSAISNWGGPGYFWLPTEDQDGLPLGNVAVQLGQHATGHTP